MINRLNKEHLKQLQEMIVTLIPDCSTMLTNTDSGCRVSMFKKDGKHEYSVEYYYFCIEILITYLVKGDRAGQTKLLTGWLSEKQLNNIHLIDYLYAHFGRSHRKFNVKVLV